MAIRPERLDHVALWVAGRDAMAARLRGIGLREIERTEAFTLLGGDARRGKLTLFDGEGPREPGVLARVGLRLPGGRGEEVDVGEGLVLRVVDGAEIDLDHVALRVADPAASARRWLDFGFRPADPAEDGAGRVELGGAFLELRPGADALPELPLLNHIGALVGSVAEQQRVAEARAIEIAELRDAPNTLALFVRGPDGVTLEYIEHKAGFSLT